jgi:hypothetical protein
LNKSKWFYLLVACVLSLGLGLGTLAQDQSSARGNLSGIVLDATKALVPGAEVTITGPIGKLTQTTNDHGEFLFSTLIPGYYTVRVQKAGFKIASIGSTEVLINKTSSIEVSLETGEVTQTVEVSAATMTVDTTAASVNADYSDTFYSKIPLGRGVSGLFYLAPGVVDGGGTGQANPSISGSSGLENLYVADGVSINDPAFGGIGVWSRAYGPLGTGINLSFVKEVQIKTGGFEPQYGHVSGGIVQLVTKSGGTKFFGNIGGYINTRVMQTNYENADDPKFNVTNLVGSRINNANYEGDFELGGYVPLKGLRDRLFFFGTFNPSWNHGYYAPAINSGLFTIYNGEVDRYTERKDYAGKLTLKLTNSQTIESTISADPSTTNVAPYAFLTANDKTANSSWDYGTRNWSVRYDGAFGSSFFVDGAFTWGWNHFQEKPLFDITQIVDETQVYNQSGQRGSFNAQGFGFFEPYDSNTKGISGDASKVFHFLGSQHTLSAGYTWQFPTYNDITSYSGGHFTVPQLNQSGTDPGYDNQNNPPVAGSSANAALVLELACVSSPSATNATSGCGTTDNSTVCTLCPLMNIPGYSSPVPVVLHQVRGRFDSGINRSTGRYHAAFINDAWEMGKHVTLNLGARWEQQRLTGNFVSKVFNDMWSPRVGVIVDPKGDRKSKFYANYGRYAFVLPLDAAVRSLSSEDDLQNTYWAPASDASGNVVLDAQNSATFQPDSAHLLNKAAGGVPIGAGSLVSGPGEAFAAGTKMEFTDEFVVGYDREFRGGIVASVRYIDRRLKRVIEDQGGISVEEFNSGVPLTYVIGNPNAAQDIFVNPNETLFGIGTTVDTASLSAAVAANMADPTSCAGQPVGCVTRQQSAQALVAMGFPSACIDSNNFATPYVAYNQTNGVNAVVGGGPAGSVCFPSVNTGTWSSVNSAGIASLLPDCTSQSQAKAGGCAAFGGEFYADGKPDTYKDPKREYEAVEFEVVKSFSHNWALSVNYRIAQLRGNYEGAFRNDNGQADPGISSLFDFTEGSLGLLQNQQSIGFLNGDRKHVLNMHATYVLPNGRMKGLVLGTGLRVQSGVPLTTLVAQQGYQNPGEVPFFGRGDLGRAPVTGTVDAHIEYPIRITERMHLKLGFDVFNIGNTKRETTVNQFFDQGFGLANSDFKKPYTQPQFITQGFIDPFTSRLSIRLEF